MSTNQNDIAIIGISIRFPGANTTEKFWENLCNGKESITFFEEDELINSGVSEAIISDPKFVKALPKLENIDLFDADFFGYSPKEAAIIDPQGRLLLECAWEALENSGYTSEKTNDSIGVFVGSNWSSYLTRNLAHLIAKEEAIQDEVNYIYPNSSDYLATNIAYKLNLKGPSVSVQTWCTTSLSSIHTACQNILNNSCDMALAGGAHIRLPQIGYYYQEGGHDSPDAHCRSFDINSNGTVPGNGLGIFVLKKLNKAIEDGDHIYAVIKGSSLNNDGNPPQKLSYHGVTVNGQVTAINDVLSKTNTKPEEISYIEASGGATALCDRIELKALTKSYKNDSNHRIQLGSVQPNVGQLGNASGMPSLTKVVLALKHKTLPPTINFTKINPKIGFKKELFSINNELTEWKKNGSPRKAALNSFGLGGTNIHLILEEAPSARATMCSSNPKLITLSAKTASALDKKTKDLISYLRKESSANFDDIAYSLNIGRKEFDYRTAFVCNSRNEAIRNLELLLFNKKINQINDDIPSLAFILPDEDLELISFYHELLKSAPSLKQTFDNYADDIKNKYNIDVANIKNALDSGNTSSKELKILQFIAEYLISKFYLEHGVSPKYFLGYGVGEFVALCLSGFLSFEDALALITGKGNEINFTINNPSFPVYSTIEDRYLTREDLQSDTYWKKILLENKPFSGNAFNLKENDSPIILEIGSGSTLNLLKSGFNNLNTVFTIVCFNNISNINNLYNNIVNLWNSGLKINWNEFYNNEVRNRIPLPTYPFERKRYWIEPSPKTKSLELNDLTNKKEVADKNTNKDLTDITEIEENISSIWKVLLGVENIKSDDDFFLLGGHSLLVTMFINRLKVTFPDFELKNSDIYNNSTLKKIAEFISDKKNIKEVGKKKNEVFISKYKETNNTGRYKLLENYLIEKISTGLKVEKSIINNSFNLKEQGIHSIKNELHTDLSTELDLPIYEWEIINKTSISEFTSFVKKEFELRIGIHDDGKAMNRVVEKTKLANTVPGPFKKNKPAIFILSAPRSGSTLFRLILEGNSSLFSPPEFNLLTYSSMKEWNSNVARYSKVHGGLSHSIKELFGYNNENSDKYLEDLIEKDYSIQNVYKILQDKLGERILVDKSPYYARSLEVLKRAEQMFDNPLFIHLVRHPYSVIESLVRMRVYAKYTEEVTNPHKASENDWVNRNQNILSFLKDVDSKRQITIRYEDVINDSNTTINKVTDFLNIKFESSMLQPYEGKKMIGGDGDPNIFNHVGLDKNLAEKWKTIELPGPLDKEAQILAKLFNYELP